MRKRLSADVLEYFRQQGAKGGKIGGKRAAALLSPAERKARATKASLAAARARTAKKHAKLARDADARARRELEVERILIDDLDGPDGNVQ